AVLGDYAVLAARELLTANKYDQHPTALADLFRARLGTCVELRDGAALDAARVKALTGGDTIKARRMRENHWSYEPTAKLVIATTGCARAASDAVAQSLADEDLAVEPGRSIPSHELQNAHSSWCEANGHDPRSHWQTVQRRLKELGAQPRKSHGARSWSGLG